MPRLVKHDAAPMQRAETAMELVEALQSASSWIGVVRVLHHSLGLTPAEIARASNTTAVTVGRWLNGQTTEVRDPGTLDDLRVVVLSVARQGRLKPELLRFWLGAKDVVLGCDALTAISQGRFEEAIDAGRDYGSLGADSIPSREPQTRADQPDYNSRRASEDSASATMRDPKPWPFAKPIPNSDERLPESASRG